MTFIFISFKFDLPFAAGNCARQPFNLFKNSKHCYVINVVYHMKEVLIHLLYLCIYIFENSSNLVMNYPLIIIQRMDDF